MLKYPESTENRTDNITHPVSAAPRAFCNSQHLMTCGQSACLCSQAAFNSLQLIKPFTESHYRARHLCWGCTNMNKCQGLQELFVSREDRWRVSAHSWQALSCTRESVERWGSWDAACAPVDKLCVWLWRKGWLFLICTNGQGVLPAALDWGSLAAAAAAAKSLQSYPTVRPHRRQPTRLPCPWDYPGKNNRVGCYFLLQCLKMKSEREVVQSCLTLGDPMDCSPPGSSVHGIFQARVLEWGAIAFSGGTALEFINIKTKVGLPWWSTA